MALVLHLFSQAEATKKYSVVAISLLTGVFLIGDNTSEETLQSNSTFLTLPFLIQGSQEISEGNSWEVVVKLVLSLQHDSRAGNEVMAKRDEKISFPPLN